MKSAVIEINPNWKAALRCDPKGNARGLNPGEPSRPPLVLRAPNYSICRIIFCMMWTERIARSNALHQTDFFAAH